MAAKRNGEEASTTAGEMMDTHEVARYLRVKERKIYELVRDRRIPCVRVTGKWLFPRALVDQWVMSQTEAGGAVQPGRSPGAAAPPVVAGSHDPLLEWSIRESGSGLAMLPGGSLDGLAKLAAGEAAAAAVHLVDGETGDYNVAAVRERLPGEPVVVIEWAWREQGLVVAAGNPHGVRGVVDLRRKPLRVIRRQEEAGTQVLFNHTLARAGIAPEELSYAPGVARSELDVGIAVSEGSADAGPAIAAVARTLRLGFVPLCRERLDLVVRRRDYFEPPFQKLLAVTRSPAFAERAAAFGGYDVSGLGRVHYNGP